MMILATAAAKSGSATHYAWYAAFLAAVLAAVAWIVKRFCGAFLDRMGSDSVPVLVRVFTRGRLGGTRLRKYQRAVQVNFSGHAPGFAGAEPIDIRRVYVPLSYEATGRREDVYARVRAEIRSVVTGPAGAGKSLLLKNSMLMWAESSAARHGRHRDRSVPVLIELHRCNSTDSDLVQLALEELRRNQVRRPRSFVEKAVRDGQLRLLLDGLDEVGAERREQVLKMIMDFATENPACQIVVTCRDAVYRGELSERFPHVVRIADFDDASIRRFLRNWPGMERADVDSLTASLRSNPSLMHLARSPLLLTMIAYLYVNRFARKSRSLPASRATFYETAISHLLDRDRELARAGSLSVYETGEKLPVLQRIAITLQRSAAGTDDRREISYAAALEVTRSMLRDINLDQTHAKPLFMEIVDRSQLLAPLDYRRTEFTFRHLTFQEFLTARELADRPDDLLAAYLKDPDSWREVVKLWCGGIRDCTRMVREVLSGGTLQQQLLALECLAEAKHIDDKFAGQVIDGFMQRLRDPNENEEDRQALIAVFGSVAAAGGPRGERVLDELSGMATRQGQERLTAWQALSASGRQEAAAALANLAALDDQARAALRAMGELAIPVLAERAEADDQQAVDDLAFIGTPAAAEALAGLLQTSQTVAVRAAWRLAELLTNPDVEEGLKNSRYQALGGARPAYDWIWQPFASPGTQDGPINSIIAQVAELIEANPGYAPDSDTGVDPRIAIPLSGLAIKSKLEEDIASFHRRLEQNPLIPKDGETYFIELAKSLAPADDERDRVSALLEELDLNTAHRALIERLPWSARVRLLATVFGTRITSTDQRDWQNVQTASKPGRALWVTFGTVLALGIGCAIIFGGYWQIDTASFWPHWKAPAWTKLPNWMNWAKLPTGTTWAHWPTWAKWCTLPIAIIFILLSISSENKSAKPKDKKIKIITADELIGLATLAGFILVINEILNGIGMLVTWFGWNDVILAFTMAACGMGLLFWLAKRRDRRYGNPLRACLLASNRQFVDRTSVIKPGRAARRFSA